MYVRPTSTRLFSGMLMPAIRAIDYPCRCLCRGFEQITSTAPWRRMILHFSHMGLTEGRTFTISVDSFEELLTDDVALAAVPAAATSRGFTVRARGLATSHASSRDAT